MKDDEIGAFLHKLAKIQGALDATVKSLANPKGNHEMAKNIQIEAMKQFYFTTNEFLQQFKENSQMKPSQLALLGLMATTSLHAEGVAPKKVALFLKASGNAFYDGIVIGAKEEAAKHNFEITTFYGSHEDDWQAEVNFLTKEAENYDAFIVDPIRSDVLKEALKHLSNLKKPIVIVDSPLTEGGENALATISSDNFIGGKLAGLFIAGELERGIRPPKCVVHLSGNAKAKGHIDRNDGFISILRDRLPQIEVKTFQGLSSFDQAKKITLENITAIGACDAVFAGSDTMILGVLSAFEERKIRPPTILVGYDAILEAQRKILDGKITASVEQFPSQMGTRAVQTLSSFFRGEQIQKEQLVLPQLSMRKLEVKTYSEKDLEFMRSLKRPKTGTKG